MKANAMERTVFVYVTFSTSFALCLRRPQIYNIFIAPLLGFGPISSSRHSRFEKVVTRPFAGGNVVLNFTESFFICHSDFVFQLLFLRSVHFLTNNLIPWWILAYLTPFICSLDNQSLFVSSSIQSLISLSNSLSIHLTYIMVFIHLLIHSAFIYSSLPQITIIIDDCQNDFIPNSTFLF